MRVDFADIQNKVRIFFSVGRFESAEKILLSALDDYGSLANLHNLLGVTYHKQGRFADAVIQFTKSLKINHTFIEAGLNLSAVLCDLGRYDEAKTVFAEISNLTQSNKPQPNLILGRLANHHAACGVLYAQNNLPHEAINEYKKALSLYEKMPDVKISLGQEYLKTKQIDRALIEFQDAVRQFPDEADAHLWYGICLWRADRKEQALHHWHTAHSLEPSETVAKSYLAMAQLQNQLA